MADLPLREGIKDPNPENKGLGMLRLEFWYMFYVLRFPVIPLSSSDRASRRFQQWIFGQGSPILMR